jgi:glycerol uptake facilitator-like aquaporin
VPGFVVAQLLGAAAATGLFRWLVPTLPAFASRVIDRDPAVGEASTREEIT